MMYYIVFVLGGKDSMEGFVKFFESQWSGGFVYWVNNDYVYIFVVFIFKLLEVC